jgi:hypothetical protein
MTKSTVTRLFLGGVIAVAAGAVVAVLAVALAYANGSFVMNGADVVGIQQNGLTWALLAVGVVSAIVILGGAIAAFIAWIGALLNTAQLESKTWFLVLLLLGIFNLGFFAMIAYLIAGPDGARRPAPVAVAAPA